MSKKNKHKSFWDKVRFKYKLSFFNENTLEEVWTFRLSQLSAFIVFFFLGVILFAAAAFFIIKTPIKNLLPGYLKTEARVQLIDNNLQLDSIEKVIALRQLYLNNLQNILSGNINFDSIQVRDSILIFPADSLLHKSQKEADFVKKFEEDEKYTLSVIPNIISTDGLIFFVPAKGPVKKKFNLAENHLGIDILAENRTGIASILDGTVIFANYIPNEGYAIGVQHNNDFISIYKYNSGLLKQIGDKVKGGEMIAISGTGDKNESGPILEFQLWHKGEPLNPEEYISF